MNKNFPIIGNRLQAFAIRVGRSAARTPLLLYYVLQSKDTSKSDKAIIATCLAYLILPVDLIPTSKFSIFGWADELLSIEIVFDRMRKYLTPEMYERAERQLDKWMPRKASTTTVNSNPTVGTGMVNQNKYYSPEEIAKMISKKWN